MRRVLIREYDTLWVEGAAPAHTPASHILPAILMERLERWDRQQAARRPQTRRAEPAPTVFDWSRRGAAWANNQWVGVLEVPGVSVEILPKLDRVQDARDAHIRANLLHMLAIGGQVRHLPADIARLAASDAPLHLLFVELFAHRLLSELQRGVQRGYVTRQEPQAALRGRLLVRQQARAGESAMQRLWCEFDEFEADIPLNRALLATCRALLQLALPAYTAATLRRAAALLDDVSPVATTPADIDAIPRTRQTTRWEELLAFARIILAGLSPEPSAGESRCFSLLFLMWEVFESFVAGLLNQHILPGTGLTLHPQGAGFAQRALFWEGDRPLGELLPDVLLARDGQPVFILDTKWKQLNPKEQPSGDNLYQLHGYATTYGVSHVCLLYPEAAAPLRRAASTRTGPPLRLSIWSIDLRPDLGDPRHLDALCGSLRVLLAPHL